MTTIPETTPETTPEAPTPSSDIRENVASVFQQHQSEIQRRSHLSANVTSNETFPRIEDGCEEYDFKIPDQQWIVFSLSHKYFAPVATDPTNPGVRIYGAFETNEEAVEHAKSLMSQDPKTSFMVNQTHTWIAAVESPQRLPESDKVIERVLNEYHAEREKAKRDFEENVACKEIVNDTTCTDDTEPVKTENTQVASTLKKLTNLGRATDQNIVVGTFLKDKTKDCEFVFQVYGCMPDETTAHKWVSNVVGDTVKDYDIDVVACGHWVFPQSMHAKHSKKEVYRSSELNSIMKEHRAQPKRVQEFQRECGEPPENVAAENVPSENVAAENVPTVT